MSNEILKPSQEKRWLQYYSKEQRNIIVPNQTIFESIMQINEKRNNLIAFNYYGRKITYGDFFNDVYKCIYGLKAQGIEKGDRVTFLTPTLYESICLFYATTYLGAAVNLIDPRVNVENIEVFMDREPAKLVAAVDMAYPKIKSLLEKKGIPVLRLSPNDSLPFGLQLGKEAKDMIELMRHPKPVMPKKGLFMTYKDFIRNGEKQHLHTLESGYEKSGIAAIEYTGGTTGIQKGAQLSTDTINAQIFMQTKILERMRVGDTFLNIMPMFLSYGLVCGAITSLSRSMEVIIEPGFKAQITEEELKRGEKPKRLDEVLLKYKPNHMCGVPVFYEQLLESELLKGEDMSFLITTIAGGAPMTVSSEKRVNEFFYEHGATAKITQGYGMTELAGPFAYNWFDRCHFEEGYVGIPLPLCNMKVENDAGEELGYGEVGRLYCSGPTTMLGYNTDNNGAMHKGEDGITWLETGDYARITEDGILGIVGREKRSIIRPDGHNVFPIGIEEAVSSHEAVKDVLSIGLPALGSENGEIPVAFVVLKEEFESRTKEIEEELKRISLEKLPERDVALRYFYVKELPYTSGAKPDFKKLKELYEQGKLEFVNLEEENTLRLKRRAI